jgi:hypothetical protein
MARAHSALVKACTELLTLRGAVAIPITTILVPIPGQEERKGRLRSAPSGTSDILACYRGRFLAIECKTHKDSLSKPQQDFFAKVAAAGGQAWMIRDVLELDLKLGRQA